MFKKKSLYWLLSALVGTIAISNVLHSLRLLPTLSDHESHSLWGPLGI